MTRFAEEFKRVQETLADAAKIGSKEVVRKFGQAKKQMERVHLVYRRKELMAELGRALYEAHKDGVSKELGDFIKNTEFQEIFEEVAALDAELEKR